MNNAVAGNNKRIAKNTLILYVRMFITMGISLYTVRVVLDALGIVDYGLHNVIAGVVTMLGFLSNSMSSASQRFFSFELGTGNLDRLRKLFSMTIQIYFILAVVILLLAETIGFWFMNTNLTIPEERVQAAQWVYHFSVLSFVFTIISSPFNALMIAHERLNIYAWVSVIEVVLKLLIAYLLTWFEYDRLIVYAILYFTVTFIITGIYRTYCQKNFDESRWRSYWESGLFKEIIGYSSWNLIGSVSFIAKGQGVNILLNIFFGPVINATKSISNQVSNFLGQFVSNFSRAASPQITKYYAANEKDNMLGLVFFISKFSYLLYFALVVPIITNTEFILSLWLKEIPERAVLFTQLAIINSLIDTLSSPLITSALATGKIRNYQIITGGLLLLTLPVVYLFLKAGYPPEVSLYILIISTIAAICVRVVILKLMIDLSIKEYLKKVILPISCVSLVTLSLSIPFVFWIQSDWLRLITIGIVGTISLVISTYYFGMNQSERSQIMIFVRKKIKI